MFIKALSARFVPVLALLSGMALVLSAYASEGHGAPAPHEEELKDPPPLRPSLRPDLKASASKKAEHDKATSEHEGGREGAREGSRGGATASKPEPAVATDGKTSVSMAELRDMIDQKIAEVRTKREVPPVVRLRPKAKPVKRASESDEQHAATHDAHGALLPLDTSSVRSPNPMGHDVHWAYGGDTGPENWGRLKPEFQQCMLGKRQSPIDIRDGIPVQMDPIQFEYRPSGFRVIDNGHTVQVNVESGNGIVVQGHRYELVQFHFHRPSEERINGRQYEMVAHLVHKDLDGKLAVVAVLMDLGKSHPIVQQVWNNLPLEKNVEQASLSQIDLNMLVPDLRQYYTYMGSLTTPPCSEGVLWLVMKHPAAMSREQVMVFSKLYQMNARPIQSAAGRLIKDGQ